MKVVRRVFLKSTIAFALAAGFLMSAPASLKAADTLPSQLSDETFWKMIENFSEEGGTFTSENFSSNELGYQPLISKLLGIIRRPKKVDPVLAEQPVD